MTDKWLCSACNFRFKPDPWQTDVQCPRCGSLIDDPGNEEPVETPTNVRPKKEPPPPPKEPPIPHEIQALDDLGQYDSVRPVTSGLPSLSARTEIGGPAPSSPSPPPSSDRTSVDMGEPESSDAETGEGKTGPGEDDSHTAIRTDDQNSAVPRTMLSPWRPLLRAYGPTLLACILFLGWVIYEKRNWAHVVPTPAPQTSIPEAETMTDIEPLLVDAIRSAQEGNTEEAIRLLDEALKKVPNSALAKELRGWLAPPAPTETDEPSLDPIDPTAIP